jgi:hypothetical protein
MTQAENPLSHPQSEAIWMPEAINGRFRAFLATPEAQYTGINPSEYEAHYLSSTMEKFLEHVDAQYSESDAQLITDSAILATVLHQFNDSEDARFRHGTHEDDTHSQIPYMEHPLGAASILAGMPSEIDVVTGHEKHVKIPVLQNPMKATIVSAALLHDVLEDCTYAGESGEALKQRIVAYLGAGTDAQKVMKIVEAVTKFDKVEVAKLQDDHPLRDEELYKAICDQTLARSEDNDSEDVHAKIQDQVERTLMDTFKMFSTSFIGEDGLPHMDDESLELFFSAFAVKAHDIEHNLSTPGEKGVRSDKLIRAHTFAVLARVLGYPVASRLGIHLISGNQYSMSQDSHAAELQMVEDYAESEREREKGKRLRIYTPNGKIPCNSTANQIPILLQTERDSMGGHIDPSLQHLIKLPDDDMRQLDDSEKVKIQFGGNFTRLLRKLIPTVVRRYDGLRIEGRIHQVIEAWGRKQLYFDVETKIKGKKKTLAILHIMDEQPTGYDVIKQDSTIPASTPPEAGVFATFDGTMKSMLDILSQFYPFSMESAASA